MLTKKDIDQIAAELGFSAAYCIAPSETDAVSEGIRTMILLTRNYMPGNGLVDAFYPCSNAAYHAASHMIRILKERCGAHAERLGAVKVKSVCSRIPAFGQGKNTLNYLPGTGSRFCAEMIGITEEIYGEEGECFPPKLLPCDSCSRCRTACPTGAITEHGFIKERCIRFHMLSGKPMPEEYRELIGTLPGVHAILGCEVCQRACPANSENGLSSEEEAPYKLGDYLVMSDDTLAGFAERYGRNYANRNRILAQAALAAGNSGDPSLIPLLERLLDSSSETVAEHARWAIGRLKQE
ncbi:MAG: hypothetical protein IK133_00865 [Clostridia bacterium]|nr:hypothetical protein [Clostridia bacterium]